MSIGAVRKWVFLLCCFCPSLAFAQPIQVLAASGVAGKINAETLSKVISGEISHFIVEFRDPDVTNDLRADFVRRRLRKLDAAALSLKHDRYRQLKSRNFSALPPGDIDIVRDFSHLPMSLVRARDYAALIRLLAQTDVIAVYENQRAQPAASALDLIGQPQASQLLGHTGAGATVVVLDTGVDYTLANFGSCSVPLPAVPPPACKVAAAFDLTLAYGNYPYPPVLGVPPYYPTYDDGSRDTAGHGTGVAATLLSAAPNARIVAIDVMNEPPWSDFTGATTDSLLAGINWAMINQTAYNIVAINMSLAGGPVYAAPCAANNPLSTAVQQAKDDHGILTVAASGNNSSANGLPWPACTPGVLSVGSVYDANVSTCVPGLKDTVVCGANVSNYLSLLTPALATSYAAPLASGAAAVLAAAFPAESPDNWVIRMTTTGRPVLDNRANGLGYIIPRLDITAALLYPSVTAPVNDNFADASTLSGNSGTTLGWNFHATPENGEPSHAGMSGGTSTWWKWTASASGNVSLNSHGSNFDTLLSVYSGDSVGTLSSVTANDNDGVDGGVSGLSFHADAGSTYYFAIAGKGGATGDLYLNRSFTADPPTTANLSVTLSATPEPPVAGSSLTYTLTVRNSGPASAVNVTTSQMLPAGTTFESADAGCTYSSGAVACTLGTLAAGGQISRAIRVSVTAAGSLSSQVVVNSATADGNPANNTAMVASTALDGSGDVPLPGWALAILAAGLLAATRRAK